MRRWMALALMALPLPVMAQTEIVPDIGNALATGTVTTQIGNVTRISGGTRVGDNLFHSFSTFNLANGDVARWTATNPDTVRAVVNRVTGGTPSTIGGTINSMAMPNADFYFINPAGIVFTEGARVNVPAAAWFSTADALRFADGGSFLATTASGSQFSMANPVGFGFLGQNAPITIAGDGRNLDPDYRPADYGSTLRFNRLALVAGDIDIEAASMRGGVLDLFAVGDGAGNIGLGNPLDADRLTGNIGLFYSDIRLPASESSGDGVRINAGDFRSIDSSFITEANALGTGDIRLKAKDVLFSGSLLSTTTDNAANSGAIFMLADTVRIDLGSWARTDTKSGDTGDAGEVRIQARTLTLEESRLSSSSTSTGDSGNIDLKLDSLAMTQGIIASDILLDSTGDGGLINIDARDIMMERSSAISSGTEGTGNAGDIVVQADSLVMSFTSGLSVEAIGSSGRGASGNIRVNAGLIEMSAQSIITASINGGSTPGSIDIVAHDMRLFDLSKISLEVRDATDDVAGLIRIRTGSLLLQAGQVNASTFTGVRGGNIDIAADLVRLDGGFSGILSEAYSSGRAGDISIDAGRLAMSGNEDTGIPIISSETLLFPGVTTVAAARAVTGDAGNVVVNAGALVMDGGEITSSTKSFGNAGSVSISGGTASLSGGAAITSAANQVAFFRSGGTEVTLNTTSKAGSVNIGVDRLDAGSGALVSTSTFSNGDAGDVIVNAGTLRLFGGARLTSTASSNGIGRSGLIQVMAGDISLSDGALVQTGSANRRPAGAIQMTATGMLELSGIGTAIASEGRNAEAGDAGAIALSAREIRVNDGALVSTNSVAGDAGAITISLPRDGRLFLTAGDRGPGVITTSSGPGTGGIITIANPYVVVADGARILALGQQGGANVRLTADYFIRSADRLNLVSVSGNLIVQSQVGDVSGGTEAPDISFIDAAGVLAGQCGAARVSGDVSQIAITPIGVTAGEGSGRCD